MLRGHRQISLEEQSVGSVWDIRVKGPGDLQALRGPGTDIRAVMFLSAILLEAPRDNLSLCLFQILEATYVLWLAAPSSIFKPLAHHFPIYIHLYCQISSD